MQHLPVYSIHREGYCHLPYQHGELVGKYGLVGCGAGIPCAETNSKFEGDLAPAQSKSKSPGDTPGDATSKREGSHYATQHWTRKHAETMTASLPQSVAPGVAFEIALEKKTDSPRSAIQKRLENSPRRGDTRLEDVQSKLKRANERKGQLEAEALASTASHNAKVKQVHETSKAEAADKLKALSDGAQKRLEAAAAKRDGHRDSWVKVGSSRLCFVEHSSTHLPFV